MAGEMRTAKGTVVSEEARIEIEGLKEAQDKLVSVAEMMTGGQRGILSRGILRLHRYMSGIVRVDTGRLKNSLHPFVEERSAAIRTNVVYALPLEFMRGGKYSYIRRTAREEGPAVSQGIVTALGRDISDAFGA